MKPNQLSYDYELLIYSSIKAKQLY